LGAPRTDDDHRAQLEAWMRSYRPEELFDERGAPTAAIRDTAPRGDRRMSASPHANGGALLVDLKLPDFAQCAVDVPSPGAVIEESTRVLGRWLRGVVQQNPHNFRVM